MPRACAASSVAVTRGRSTAPSCGPSAGSGSSGPRAAPRRLGAVHFSAHMVQHMMLMMIVPLLLVRPRPSPSRCAPAGPAGPHEGAARGAAAIMHSRSLQIVTNPIVAACCSSAASRLLLHRPVPALPLDAHGSPAHDLPLPFRRLPVRVGAHRRRPGTAARRRRCGSSSCSRRSVPRVLRTRADDGRHGARTRLVGVDRQDRHRGALADQHRAGGIAWGVGELPTLILILILGIMWARDDDREASGSTARPTVTATPS